MRLRLTISLAVAVVLSTGLVATAGTPARAATGESAVSSARALSFPQPHRPEPIDASGLPLAPAMPTASSRVARLAPALQRPGRPAHERVHVQISGLAAQVTTAVRHAGGRVLASTPSEVSARVPRASLAGLAASAGVREVVPAVEAVPDNAGPSEGVATSGASAWQSAGTNGSGVTMAIVDVGFKNLDAEINAGNLPDIQYESDACTDINASEHGTAVAEIVHQMAPAAQLRLYCIEDTTGFADAASDIVAHGVPIANSSLTFPGDSRGDGTGDAESAATAVEAARRAGVLWVTSAGNTAQDHWTGTFADADHDGRTDLDGVGANNEHDAIVPDPGVGANVYLTWDAWPTSSAPVTLVATAYNCTQSGGCPATPIPCPISACSVTQTPGAAPVLSFPPGDELTRAVNGPTFREWAISVQQGAGTPAVRYDLSYYGAGSSLLSGENAARAASGSIESPASSPYALAVGAAAVASPYPPEPFSSEGPTIDGRVKPDILGYDDVSSNLDAYAQGFIGTSAAAPHVAGAAALVKSANPTLDAAQVEALLETRATGGSSGAAPTNVIGHGRLTVGNDSGIAAPAGSTYQPLATPQRVLDTRFGPGPLGRLGAGQVITVNLNGAPATATAVAMNLTGTQAAGNTYLTAYPSTDPGTSTLNLSSVDSTAAVFTVVPVVHNGSSATIQLRNAGASTHALIDALGYFVPSGGSRYTPVATPVRIKDTRSNPPFPTRVAANSTTPVSAASFVPPGATAAVVTVTAANETGVGFLSLSPSGAQSTSTLNYTRFTRANTTVVSLDPNRAFQVFNGGPPTDFVVDLAGYFSGSGSTFVPLTPVRVMDTRTGNGQVHAPLAAGGTLTLTGSGIFSVPFGATALMAGVVPVPSATSSESYLTIYPSSPRPTTSSVNFTGGRLVPNGVIINLAPASPGDDLTRSSQIYNAAGRADIVVDLFGYFTN